MATAGSGAGAPPAAAAPAGGGWFGSLKSFASAAGAVAVQAGTAAKNAAVATYNDLNSWPTEIKCTGCEAVLPIPPTIYDWPCLTPACVERNVIQNRDNKVCDQCNVPAPKRNPPSLTCGACQAVVELPTSNAAKHLNTAKVATVKAGTAAVEYSKSTYHELADVPKEIKCKGCALLLPVPVGFFDWTCATCEKHPIMDHTKNACDECKVAKPAGPPPTIKCEACQVVTEVPLSNFRRAVGKVVDGTVYVAKETGAAVKKNYIYLKSDPNQFNCAHCTQLLEVPPVWMCMVCQAQSSRSESPNACSSCTAARSKKPEDDAVMCGKCNLPTPIPSSNLANILKTNSKKAGRGVFQMYHNVSGKPYIVCDNCGETVSLPQEKKEEAPVAGAPAAAEPLLTGQLTPIACKGCGKEFEVKGSEADLANLPNDGAPQ